MKARHSLVTVVPLSTTPPQKVMPYHLELDIPFELPRNWGNQRRWLKGDMLYSVGFHRADLLRLEKVDGKRIYQTEALQGPIFKAIQKAVLHGLSLSDLTQHL